MSIEFYEYDDGKRNFRYEKCSERFIYKNPTSCNFETEINACKFLEEHMEDVFFEKFVTIDDNTLSILIAKTERKKNANRK